MNRNVEGSLRGGKDAYRSGNYAEAVALLTEGLEAARDGALRASLYCYRSAAQLRLNLPEAALYDANSALEVRPAWPQAHLRRGNALLLRYAGGVAVSLLCQSVVPITGRVIVMPVCCYPMCQSVVPHHRRDPFPPAPPTPIYFATTRRSNRPFAAARAFEEALALGGAGRASGSGAVSGESPAGSQDAAAANLREARVACTSAASRLRSAVVSDDVERVRELLTTDWGVQEALAAPPAELGSDDALQRPLLTLSVLLGLPDMVETLLVAGANAECPDREGRTPLWHAVSEGDAECVRLLLMAGASPATPDHLGWSPTKLAGVRRDPDVLHLLGMGPDSGAGGGSSGDDGSGHSVLRSVAWVSAGAVIVSVVTIGAYALTRKYVQGQPVAPPGSLLARAAGWVKFW